MLPRLVASRSFRLFATIPTALALVASLALPAQFVTATVSNLALTKATDATNPEAPGDSYKYTLTATTTAAVTNLIVRDSTFDYPQISVTGVTYTKNGAPGSACGSPRPDNIRCVIGDLAGPTTVVATVNVTVNPNVNVACDKPGAHGTLDNTILNAASATWSDVDGGPFTVTTPVVQVNLDCAGYDPNAAPAPDTTITSGPSGTVTSTSASFTFTGTNSPTSFRCALDGGSFATCTSPKAYSGLAKGSHTFEVQGVNATGPDGTPAERIWTIASPNPFTDINSSIFKNDILFIYNRGVTAGCTATKYCPDDKVLRDQMASFLVRALNLPATSTDYFDDDNGDIHEGNINRLAAAGITAGCAPRRYCPKDPVNRDQMASFLVRAFHLPASSTDAFTDDNGNQHQSNINALAASGITGGCAPGKYCPQIAVTRGQMAAFLHRAILN